MKNAPAELDVEVLASAYGWRQKQIVSSRIQKHRLALARFSHYIQAGRIQIDVKAKFLISHISTASKELAR